MNDRIRAIDSKLVEEAMYLTLADGTYVNNIYAGVELRRPESEERDKFRAWVAASDLFMPSGYMDDHNFDLRHLNTANSNYQKVYDDLVKHDAHLRNNIVPLMT